MERRSLMDVAGWEAFVHGVFAIAITLLVLDIRVPSAEAVANSDEMLKRLADGLPRYFAYVLGFMYLGAYWINIHRALRMLRGVDHWFLVIGLVFLMVVSAVPFVTALLAEYIGRDHGRDQLALVIFAGWQLLLSVVANISIRYGTQGGRLLRPGIDPMGLRAWMRLSLLGPVIWAAALVSAVALSGTITIVLMVVILVLFVQEAPGDLGEAGATA